jgi:hypothetical protein
MLGTPKSDRHQCFAGGREATPHGRARALGSSATPSSLAVRILSLTLASLMLGGNLQAAPHGIEELAASAAEAGIAGRYAAAMKELRAVVSDAYPKRLEELRAALPAPAGSWSPGIVTECPNSVERIVVDEFCVAKAYRKSGEEEVEVRLVKEPPVLSVISAAEIVEAPEVDRVTCMGHSGRVFRNATLREAEVRLIIGGGGGAGAILTLHRRGAEDPGLLLDLARSASLELPRIGLLLVPRPWLDGERRGIERDVSIAATMQELRQRVGSERRWGYGGVLDAARRAFYAVLVQRCQELVRLLPSSSGDWRRSDRVEWDGQVSQASYWVSVGYAGEEGQEVTVRIEVGQGALLESDYRAEAKGPGQKWSPRKEVIVSGRRIQHRVDRFSGDVELTCPLSQDVGAIRFQTASKVPLAKLTSLVAAMDLGELERVLAK